MGKTLSGYPPGYPVKPMVTVKHGPQHRRPLYDRQRRSCSGAMKAKRQETQRASYVQLPGSHPQWMTNDATATKMRSHVGPPRACQRSPERRVARTATPPTRSPGHRSRRLGARRHRRALTGRIRNELSVTRRLLARPIRQLIKPARDHATAEDASRNNRIPRGHAARSRAPPLRVEPSWPGSWPPVGLLRSEC